MRVDNVVTDVQTTVRQILLALDSRLTAADNMAPEGGSGDVLMGNGPNSPPSYKDLTEAVETILRSHGLIP